MKVATLVGSLRKESLNMQLARTMQERYNGKMELDIADLRVLPFYDQDQELNPPQAVAAFKKWIKEADAVLIITPEFNWSVPGVLKNALDWLSREEKVMIGKPVMIAGASPAMVGTIRAQLHLRQILASPGIQAKVLQPAGNEVLINLALQKFDSQTGRLTDQATLQFLDGVVERFIDFTKSSR